MNKRWINTIVVNTSAVKQNGKDLKSMCVVKEVVEPFDLTDSEDYLLLDSENYQLQVRR